MSEFGLNMTKRVEWITVHEDRIDKTIRGVREHKQCEKWTSMNACGKEKKKKTEAQELGLQRTGHSGSGPINKKTV